jgi:hypothetical protein
MADFAVEGRIGVVVTIRGCEAKGPRRAGGSKVVSELTSVCSDLPETSSDYSLPLLFFRPLLSALTPARQWLPRLVGEAMTPRFA